ncbi:MAG: aldehyde dehydrogenase family protein [Acidobacteriota bacterium]|nr:aldehyde dehydrogenase family protein [Acidobacteriota bacterium]
MEAATLVRTLKPGKFWIDGKQEDAISGKTIPVINPATSEQITTVPDASVEDVNRAVAAARRTFENGAWRNMKTSQRERIIWRIGELIEKNKEELGMLESLNNGKTYREALRGDIPPSWDIFYYYAGWARKIYGETIPVDGNYLNYTLREPVGVVGMITAWNYPLLLAAWKVAPALAAGCSMVIKPSEMTPLTTLKLAEYCLEAGVPEGVVNVVTGFGPSAGEAIARHMDVDKVAFTGSIRTARALLKASAESNLKRLSLELGGKSPNIIFPDADFDRAANAAFWGIYANKGEVCSAGSRLLVHEKVYSEFVDRIATRAKTLKVGDPLDPASEMGAQISKQQMERILGYVESGKQEGADLLCGGERDTEGAKARGYYVKPAVFAGVKPEMKIAQEEIFGPVLAAIKFRDEAEAAEIANSTIYGLVSAVWTRDVALAHRVARKIKAGSVWINDYNCFDSASPFGGYKQSGFGREMGPQALESYTQVKSVWVSLD